MLMGTNSGTRVQFQVQFLGTYRAPINHGNTMSTIVNRNGIWQARYNDANGKQLRTSTHIPVKGGNGLTAREAKKAAESIAAGLEAAAKGSASERIIRTVQMQLETVGIARKISVREWFREFQKRPEFLHTKLQTQESYCKVYRSFCDWLGKDADGAITKITSARVVDFLNYESRELKFSITTVMRHRAALRVAFNSAEHNELIQRNPVRTIRQSMLEQGREREVIMPFTHKQIAILKKELPQQLRFLMLVCLYSLGQRLADCCRMRWDMFDMKKNWLMHTTGKTKRPMLTHITKEFHQLLNEIKLQQRIDGIDSPYLFPQWAEQKRLTNVSAAFCAELNRLGMRKRIKRIESPIKGRGRAHHRHELCFHSLRHYVVSTLRSNPDFSADVVRDGVGHSCEEVERMYFAAPDERKQELASYMSSMVKAM